MTGYLDKRKYLKEVIELIRALNNRLVEEYTVAKVKYDDGEYEIDIIVKTVDEQNKISYQVLCFTPYLARKLAKDLQQILRYRKVRRPRKMARKRRRKRGNPLPSSVMKRIWRKCGSPRSNPKCWSREMKKAHRNR